MQVGTIQIKCQLMGHKLTLTYQGRDLEILKKTFLKNNLLELSEKRQRNRIINIRMPLHKSMVTQKLE